jgi:hypothetical protein
VSQRPLGFHAQRPNTCKGTIIVVAHQTVIVGAIAPGVATPASVASAHAAVVAAAAVAAAAVATATRFVRV